MNYGRSPKIKRNKLELDVERYRSECRWAKARDILNLLKTDKQTPSIISLINLVQAEYKLEKIVNEKDSINPEESIEIKSNLEVSINGADEAYKLEAKIMLAKLKFQQGKYKEVIASLEALNLKNIKIDQGSARLTKLVAESFAMLGLSIEKMEGEAENDIKNETLDSIIENLNLAGDIGLFHLQELEKSVRQNPATAADTQDEMENSAVMTKLLSKAIQRSPIVSILHNDLPNAINRYRELLRYCETEMTKPLRQTLARQLAEVLLRGVCLANYNPIQVESEANAPSTTNTITNKGSHGTLTPSTAAMWRTPAKYPIYSVPAATNSNNALFKPTTLHQEVVLLLLISEYLANQEAVLNRSQEHTEARLSTLYNSQAVYDLLAISLTRLNCLPQLCQLLQHSLRFSYKEYHSWYQLALALVSAKHHLEAYFILQECHRIDDNRPDAFQLASAICIEVLSTAATSSREQQEKLQSGYNLAEKACALYTSRKSNTMTARSHLLMARALSLMAQFSKLHQDKQKLQQKAISLFKQATIEDKEDWLGFYLLAMEHAFARQLQSAMESCCQAVQLAGSGCSGSEIASAPLHLLTLLHSATGRLSEACSIAEAALLDHPSDLGLLQTLARLHLSLHGPKAALQVYRRVLETSRDLEPSNVLSRPLQQQQQPQAVPPLSVSNNSPSQLSLSIQPLGYEAMLGLAQLYLDSKMPEEASRCLETVALSCNCVDHNLLLLRARCHEMNGLTKEAQTLYENCLVLCSSNITAVQKLATLLKQKHQFQLAEKTLRDAINLDPNDSTSWQLLGELFTELANRYVTHFDNGLVTLDSSSDSTDDITLPQLNSINSQQRKDQSIKPGMIQKGNSGPIFGGIGAGNNYDYGHNRFGFLDISQLDDDSTFFDNQTEDLLSNKFLLNRIGYNEVIDYSIKCLSVAADLQLTDPIRSFHVLHRAVKQF